MVSDFAGMTDNLSKLRTTLFTTSIGVKVLESVYTDPDFSD